jgi:uncharacterized membrane protein
MAYTNADDASETTESAALDPAAAALTGVLPGQSRGSAAARATRSAGADTADGVTATHTAAAGNGTDAATRSSTPGSAEPAAHTGGSRTTRHLVLRRRPFTLEAAGPWLLAAGLTIVYLLISIARYERFAPTSWDLGLFTEEVKQYAHFHAPIDDARSPGYEILGEHFSPIVALLGPFFLVFPTPITLLVAQAALFALGAVPLVRLCAERIGPGAAHAIGAAYGLSFGLAEAVDADFHEVAFAVPIIAFSLCALLRGKHNQAAVWALLLVFAKEDLGITVVLPIGIALILWGRALLGAAVSVAGVAGTLLAVYWIIPSLSPTHTYEYWNKGGCADPTRPGGARPVTCLIGQSLQNPGGKLELLFLLLSITAFVALRSPLVLFAVPNLGSRFITTNATFWGTAWHYNAVLMPILFVAAADGIMRARAAGALTAGSAGRRWARGVSAAMSRHGAVAMLAVAVAIVPQYAYNQLFDPNTFTFNARTQALGQAMAQVPDGVTVETTINMLAPLAARADAFWVGNPVPADPPQYVVFDQVVSGFSPQIGDVPGFERQRYPAARYTVIYHDDFGIFVLRRTS